MNLSDNFTLAELTHSQTADRLGLDNTPDSTVVIHLTRLAQGLEKVRNLVQVLRFTSITARHLLRHFLLSQWHLELVWQ